MAKKLLIAAAAIVGVLVLAAIGIGLFLDANQFRPALATRMSDALGRRVEIGNLKISWLSGGIAAEDLVITDDPAFSKQPFVSAKSVSIGVDLMPLIVSRSLRVQSFTLDQPRVALIRSKSGAWNFSTLGGGSSSSGSMGAVSVLIQKIKIAGGQVSILGLDGSRAASSYDAVDVSVTNLSLTSPFPFAVSAKAPGGGTLSVDGEAGPFNMKDIAETPFHGSISIKHLDVATTGFIDPASGIGGVLDFSGTLASNGAVITTKGKASVDGLRLLPGASNSRAPVAIDYESSYNAKSQTATLKQLNIHVGKALATMNGEYRTSGKTSTAGMMFNAGDLPVTELEAALPAIGVTLPSGASLTQGMLTTALGISGPVDQLMIAGPLKLANAKLQGFDLGAKLSAIAALAGVSRVGDTLIESLSGTLRMTPGGLRVDALAMVVPSIGTLTGEGTIAPGGAMDFAMLAKLREGAGAAASGGLARIASYGQASGVPFRIQGTTKNPSFVPDVGRAVKDVVKNPENLKKATDAIGDLFRRK